ncbi:ShET2/EspL2 family type III secretion system effector toxin [Candidatus Ichthyocystis sparus]|uniref:ShET2/EspL2 family type III secretion system effector toxin n=1 Tax=Candidatus Ichthyocystis sparus TaxID=1561004 RepID=UPI000B83C20E|nr:ShET2/EspL2 family type III secretion system effector toxin [Candidatus Ichthyocystis sparus]
MAISGNSSIRVSVLSGEEMPPGDKSVPYISKLFLQQEALNLNYKVNVSGMKMNCTHLSALYLRNAVDCHLKNKKLVIGDIFGSATSIESIVPENVNSIFGDIIDGSCGRHIVACRKFGGFLCGIAKDTSLYEQRLFLLVSSYHTMAFRLLHKISCKTLRSRYVICFFDPNMTNVVARVAVNDPNDFLDEARFSLQSFIDRSLYEEYFKILTDQPEECECIIYEHCELKDANKDFLTFQTLSQYGISSCIVFHLMSDGGANDVMGLANTLSLLNSGSDFRREIFLGKNSAGVPALYAALGFGRHENIDAYGSLLDTMSSDEMLKFLPELLRAENVEGTPGLFLALKKGYAKSVAAYGRLLDKLLGMSDKMPRYTIASILFNLLMARRRGDGLPGLFVALQGNHYEAISEFCSLLDILLSIRDELSVSELCSMIYDLLMSSRRDGVSGLQIALFRDNSESVQAFGELILRFTHFNNSGHFGNVTRMVFKLLMAESLDYKPGLCLALSENNNNSVAAYGGLLEKFTLFRGGVPDCEFYNMFHELLIARYGGIPGLSMALQNGCEDSIKAFAKLVSQFISLSPQIPHDRLLVMLHELFISSSDEGVSGLFMALKQGHGGSVVAFSEILETLFMLEGGVVSIEEIFDLVHEVLVAKDNLGRPGLNAALIHGKASSVLDFGVLLDKFNFFKGKISEGKIFNTMYELIMSRDSDGCPGLFSALRDNCANVVGSYFLLVSRLRRRYWANLLIARDGRGVPAIFTAHDGVFDGYYRLLVQMPMGVFLEVHEELTEFTRHREYLDVVNRGGGSRITRYEAFLDGLTDHKNDQSGAASCDPKGCKVM